MNTKENQRRRGIIRFAMGSGIVLMLAGIAVAFFFYERIYAPAVSVPSGDPYLYIRTGTDYADLLRTLDEKHLVRSIGQFDWVAQKMNVPNHVYPGKYRLENGMSNYDLGALLRSGRQEPVKVVLGKFRLKEELSAFVAQKLEADSLAVITALNDADYLKRFSVSPDEALCLFIPNTYEFYWNSNHDQFLSRMKKEYDRFWNEERKAAAVKLNLSATEVITLSSIVDEETNYDPEKSRIAGVYLNRLRKGMPLQADPTVRFALKDFALKRILNSHLTVSSPYNTYRVTGLPPGPICTPSIASIDAVLRAERNEYYYFCADPDKPGTHVFAKDYQHHLLNARRYQRWLSQQKQ